MKINLNLPGFNTLTFVDVLKVNFYGSTEGYDLNNIKALNSVRLEVPSEKSEEFYNKAVTALNKIPTEKFVQRRVLLNENHDVLVLFFYPGWHGQTDPGWFEISN